MVVLRLREYFSQTDERVTTPRIPAMVNMTLAPLSSKKNQKLQESSLHPSSSDPNIVPNRNSMMMDDYSDEDEDFKVAEDDQRFTPQHLG